MPCPIQPYISQTLEIFGISIYLDKFWRTKPSVPFIPERMSAVFALCSQSLSGEQLLQTTGVTAQTTSRPFINIDVAFVGAGSGHTY